MENYFSIVTYYEQSEGIEEGDKAIYIIYKNKLMCCKLFKEVKDISKFLEDIYSKLLKLDSSLKIIGKLNFIYFTWLEEEMKLKEALYGKRVS